MRLWTWLRRHFCFHEAKVSDAIKVVIPEMTLTYPGGLTVKCLSRTMWVGNTTCKKCGKPVYVEGTPWSVREIPA